MNIADIWKYELRKGNTDHPRNGACLFDAGMWLVYGKIGDDPPCSCPVIRRFAIGLNDRMPSRLRSKLLKPFILRVVGNRDPSAEPERMRVIVLETARRVVPMTSDAPAFNALRLLSDDATYEEIRSAANAAAAAARAANTAYAAAWAAAYAADAANADYAADAANAAYAAAWAADADAAAKVWVVAVEILDAALRIGRQSPEFNEEYVRSSVREFALAASHAP